MRPTHAFVQENGMIQLVSDLEGYDPETLIEIPEDYNEHYHKWNGNEFVVDLEPIKQDMLNDVKLRRTHIEQAGLMIEGKGVIDTDAKSQNLIARAATAALTSLLTEQPYEICWTMKDNSRVVFTAQEVAAMNVALVQFTDALQAAYENARAAINDAKTIGQFEAIDVDSFFFG